MSIRSLPNNLWIVLACLFFSCSTITVALAEEQDEPVGVKKREEPATPLLTVEILELLERYHLTDSELSIHVFLPKSGKTLYSYQPGLALNPASAMKVLVSIAALETFGPEHRYPTEFYSSRPLQDSSLPDLWIKGYGDPFLVSEELGWMSAKLKALGVREIRGPIYVDDSYFNPEVPIKFPGTTGRGLYRVVTGALSFNFNLPPALRYRAKSLRHRSELTESTHQRPPLIDSKLTDPALYTGFSFKEALARRGVSVKGPVSFGRVPPDAEPLLFHSSRRMAEIITNLNKFSNNFIAEQLLKSLGAARFGGPASNDKGIRALAEMLRRVGVNPADCHLHNGSGLSRSNRIAASHFTTLLRHALQATYAEEFVRSLSIAGVDGTLYRLFKNSPLRGRLWAKTGSLYQVSALAGYLLVGDEPLVFAILVNGFGQALQQVQRAEEKILEAIARHVKNETT